jgi:hypothetical protein
MLQTGVDAVTGRNGQSPLLLAANPVCVRLLVESRFGRALLLGHEDPVLVTEALLQKICKMGHGPDVDHLIHAVNAVLGTGLFRAALRKRGSGFRVFESERLAKLGPHEMEPPADPTSTIAVTWCNFSEAERAVYAEKEAWARKGMSEELLAVRIQSAAVAGEETAREWERAQSALGRQEWTRVQDETRAVFRECRLAFDQAIADLNGVQNAVNVEERAQRRVELRDLIVATRPKVIAALGSLEREMKFVSHAMHFVDPSSDCARAADAAVSAFKAEVECLVALKESMELMEGPLKLLRSAKSADSFAHQLKARDSALKELQVRLAALDIGMVRASIAKAKEDAAKQFAARIAKLERMKRALVAPMVALDEKREELDRAIAAGARVEAVKAAVAAARRVLDRCKQRLTIAETELTHATEDFAVGVGSEADVNEAKKKAADARVAVAASRAKYEDAVRDLVAVRQAGFPELQCPAPARADCFPQVPTIGAKDLGELHLMPRLGAGSFASVYQIELPLVGLCAFKKFEGVVDRATLAREAAAMWELRHSEQIVRLLMLCEEPGNLGLVLELVEGGSLGALLHERKERLPESATLQILHDVARGLECVHAHKQVHLDVKSDNVLLTAQRRAKLSDFGSSKEMRNTYRDTMVRVTRQWCAPEAIQDPPQITAACDVWSFGMLMYEMLTGNIPYHDVAEVKLLQLVARGEVPSVEGIEERFVAVMRQCWQLDATARPSATQLVALIGELMKRDCLVCLSSVPLTGGVLCSREAAFLCNGCVAETMESVLKTDSAWRPDGSLAWKDTVFELSRMRLAVSAELFDRWQAAQLRAKEAQVREALRVQMEQERRRWDEMGAVERAVGVILNDLLQFSCPSCKGKLEYERGCMAIYHNKSNGGCDARFCAFCERICKDGDEAHRHVAECDANALRLPWFPNEAEAATMFAQVQRRLQIQRLQLFFQRLEDGHREAVFAKVEQHLRVLHISRQDVLGN